MKKIFGFIGSPQKETSQTYKLAKMIAESLVSKDPEISYDIYTAGMVKINFCKGCWMCVNKGFCPQDKTDDMGMLKEKMKEADFIIIGSPNYEMSISGQTKTFFDRLFSMYHVFPLAGKTCAAVMASGGPRAGIFNPEEAYIYMGAMMTAMGTKFIDFLFATTGSTKKIEDEEKCLEQSRVIAGNAYPYISGEKLVETDEYLEATFKQIKNVAMTSTLFATAKEHWEKMGWNNLNTFAELLKSVQSLKV